MKTTKLRILIFIFALLILSCEQNTASQKSNFKVSKDYAEFSSKMENHDTLNIGVALSMCMWREYNQLQITKSNDSVYLQLKEKQIMGEEPIHLKKVIYDLKNDTLNLEKMMSNFDINNQKETNSPFFIITNPKEKDTLILRTIGLADRGLKSERYKNIIAKLYPKEMAVNREKNRIPPPPPQDDNEIPETEIK